MQNKKADIPVTILVIGILGISILAILSFVKFSNNISKDFSGIGLIETMNSLNMENNFYKETEFKGDYGSVFGRKGYFGDVKIIIKEGGMEGSYAAKETGFLNLFDSKEKILIRIDYKK